MYFQKVLKGIANIPGTEAIDMVTRDGIASNWFHRKGKATSYEINDQLTEPNVLFHLNHYDDPLPKGHKYAGLPGAVTYGDVTPYISTTAGTVERMAARSMNILFPAFMTSLQFATQNFTTGGYIFYAYLLTLGKQAIPLRQFSEEVRDLLIYRQFLPYHPEGEVLAKIDIPSPQIEKAEQYDGKQAHFDLKSGKIPAPLNTILNPGYQPPEKYTNIREIL